MKMKSLRTLNLVMAIVYTVIMALIAISAVMNSEGETFVGAIILCGPVVANWITWKRLKNIELVKPTQEVEYVTTNE